MDKPLNETFFANMVEFSSWYSVKMSLLPHPWRGGGLRNHIYYIDTSVLLGNIPLVKFINATSGTRVVYFP